MRTKILLRENPNPSTDEIKKALNPHLCRCTGYKKIVEAIEMAGEKLRSGAEIIIKNEFGKIGTSLPKYSAIETALGQRHFINDINIEGMLHAALKFSDFPRAKVLNIDASEAEKTDGVIKVFTAKDIPGQHNAGLIFRDWPLMIGLGETTHYIGDVTAGVVAQTKEAAEAAAGLIKVEYEKLEDQFTAEKFDADFITDLALSAGMKYINIVANIMMDFVFLIPLIPIMTVWAVPQSVT